MNGINQRFLHQEFDKLLQQAAFVTKCSTMVGGIHIKDTERPQVAVIFYDAEKRQFAHAFRFETRAEVEELCEHLLRLQAVVEQDPRGVR